MIDAMKQFNFGPDFLQCINKLYNNSQLCVKNNGFISERFSVSRGIKQGCPLSALLFIISVEIMALNIKQNTEIKGYRMCRGKDEREVKISQYADDGR